MFAHLQYTQLPSLFRVINDKVFHSALPQISVTFNPRLVAVAGRYFPPHKQHKSVIELSIQHCTDMKTTVSVLVHEMCHAAQYEIDMEPPKVKGEKRDVHGPVFKKWAKIATDAMGDMIYPVERCFKPEVKAEKQYITKCPKCQYIGSANQRGTKCRRCKHKTEYHRNVLFKNPMKTVVKKTVTTTVKTVVKTVEKVVIDLTED